MRLRAVPCRFLVAVCVLAGVAVAQTPQNLHAAGDGGASAAVAAGDRFPAEPLVVERQDAVYRYNADGTGSRVETSVVRAQTEAAARGLGVVSLPYAAGLEQVEPVYVRVRKSNGTVVPTPVSEAQDQPAPVTVAAPLYSELHVLRLQVRGLGVGDRLETQVRRTFLHPAAKDQFWGTENFGRHAVVLERSVELRVPAGKDVLVSSPANPAEVTVDGAEKVYRWHGSQLKPTGAAGTEMGHRSTFAQEGSDPDGEQEGVPPIAWTTFHSWAEVGSWYRQLAAGQQRVTPALKARADAVVYGLPGPEERVRALYGFVSKQVRSIDVGLGLGSYQPHAAAEVLENQYGDSNDKGNLLVAMLRAEGVQAAPVLAGGDGPEIDEAVPAPGWFHHVLTRAGTGAGGGEVWLDTSPEVAPYRMLDPVLRDRRVLVIPAEGVASLQRTPAEPPFEARNQFAATGTLSAEGELRAHVDMQLRGDEELHTREILRNASPAVWDRIAAYLLRADGIGGQPSDTSASQPDETDTPLHVGFDLRQASYGEWGSFRILPLEPGLNLPMAGRTVAPTADIDFGGRRTDTATSRITLPAGYSADLPAEVRLQTPFASLEKSWKLQMAEGKAVLLTERTLRVNVDKLPAAQWPAYRQFLDAAGQSEPWIQLTAVRKGAAGNAQPPAAGEDRPAAAALVQEANQLIEAREWEAARQKLDAAKAINPVQPFLWSSYGAIAEANGDAQEAASDYGRELQRRPEEAMVSRLLATNQLRGGDRAGAIKTLKAAVELNGRDGLSVQMLAGVEAATDLPAAESTLRAGLQEVPDNNGLKLALGTVLLRANQRDEGTRLLAEVINTSDMPEQMNDAAFALGDAGLALPLAEAASRRSIQLMNAVSAREGLPAPGQAGAARTIETALLHTQQLVSAWDTYGWILLKEGNASEAEPWLRAAAADSDGAAAKAHLARLLQGQGRAGGSRGALQAGEHPSGVEGSAASRAAGSRVAGRPGSEARETKGRSFAVPHADGGLTGTATFAVEYAAGVTPRVQMIGGDPGLAGLAGEVAKLNPSTLLPPGSPAHLVREGVARCRAGAGCSFTFVRPAAVE